MPEMPISKAVIMLNDKMPACMVPVLVRVGLVSSSSIFLISLPCLNETDITPFHNNPLIIYKCSNGLYHVFVSNAMVFCQFLFYCNKYLNTGAFSCIIKNVN